jgi:glycosyltransferase involved in cell wall biosynthesis
MGSSSVKKNGSARGDESSVITFIGALPPPVTGMTAMSQVIVDALREGGPVRLLNWSRGKHLSGLRWKAARFWGACRSLATVLFGWRRGDGVIYYPLSSTWGLLYDIAILAAARLHGYRIVVHHHVYSYIDRRDWRMTLLIRSLGPDSVHVVHCEQMRDDFLARYSTDAEFLFVPPTIASRAVAALPRSNHESFTLGFMSNLTLAKGLDSALATFTRLADSGRNVALILAGPCHQPHQRRMIDEIVKKWPQRVEYRGPVYDAAKARFFTDIDVFLFPTRYKNESWGIVLTEALSANCPVIACRRGCVPWIVQNECGIVVNDPNDFVVEASQAIAKWMDDEHEYQRLRQRAGQRAKSLADEANIQFAEFLKRIREL